MVESTDLSESNAEIHRFLSIIELEISQFKDW